MQSSTLRKPSSRRWRAGLAVAFAAGAIAVLAASLRLQPGTARSTPKAETEPSAVASIAGGRSTTIIVSTPNSNDCRRYQLNVATGARDDQSSTKCAAEAEGPGRLEAISKSFRNR